MELNPLSVTQPTRRSVAKGAAWSLPVAAIAAAAPLAAASPITNDGFVQLEVFDIDPTTIHSGATISLHMNLDYDLYSGGANGPAAAAGTKIVIPTPAAFFGTSATVSHVNGTGSSISGVNVVVSGGVTTVTVNYPIQRIGNYDVDLTFVAPTISATTNGYVTNVSSLTNPNTPTQILDGTDSNNFRP